MVFARLYLETGRPQIDTSKPTDSAERVPQLTNVGARLRKEWINEVLTQRHRVRPWLHKRMPELQHQAATFAARLDVSLDLRAL